MEASDIHVIKTWADRQKKEITLYLTRSNHPEQNAFDRFSHAFSRLAPCITIAPRDKEADLPGLVLSDNITYSALPLGKELAPFLEGLSGLDDPGSNLQAPVKAKLSHLAVPVDLTLYIALECPHCPAMVRELIPMAAASDRIRLTIIDGTLFPETAKHDQVLSAPCLLLDRTFRWTGSVAPEEILGMAINRDPSQLSAQTLRTILEQGEADWICRAMMDASAIFSGFVALLLHPVWSVRLGAMVVVETLKEEAPDLASRLCPPLMAAFPRSDVPVQGDILYALGVAGTNETKAWIQTQLPELSHPDLTDAAKDALEALDEPLD